MADASSEPPVSAMDAMRDWLGEQFARVGERFDGMDARLDGMDTRLDRMDARLDRMDTRLDRMDTRIAGVELKVESRFAELEATQNVLIDSVADLHRKLGDR